MDCTCRMRKAYFTRLTQVISIVWTSQENMPQKECEDLVLQAVTQVLLIFWISSTDETWMFFWQAIRRDGSSGGCCRMAIITKVKTKQLLPSFLDICVYCVVSNYPNRTAWRGSCGWTMSCPSSTRIGGEDKPIHHFEEGIHPSNPFCINWNNFIWKPLVIYSPANQTGGT